MLPVLTPWTSCLVTWVWASVQAYLVSPMLAGWVLPRRVAGWCLAGVWLLSQGAGPANPARRRPWPAALAGWWMIVWGGHGDDGIRLQCHYALDAALPCYASYSHGTHGRSR